MRSKILSILLTTFLFAINGISNAQDYVDAENCKDHPFFNRLEKYYIEDCKENFNEYEFTIGPDKMQTLEGTVTEITYSYAGSFGPNLPSKLQIIRNYENAILKAGGKKIYHRTSDDGGWTGATFYLEKDGKEYWLGIYNLYNNPVDQFSFILLAKEAMKQDIASNEMFDKINNGESLKLFINFENSKSTIKAESQNIIEQLNKMLSENPTLKIVVEGHTDNVGNSASNQLLSEQRAASVKNALIKKGISADRIKTEGYGQDKPLSDNKSEDGKAKNRRVEIRKQ